MSDLSAAIDAYFDAVKKYVDIWTSDPDVYGAFATWLGAWTNLVMGASPGTKPKSGPIPPRGAVNPKQLPATKTVVVTPGTDTSFRPSAWVDGARHYIPDSLVTLLPSSGKAGVAQPVVVQVLPPIGVPAGKYAGTIADDTGQVLADKIEVDIQPV